MTIELYHDILARKVYEQASAGEKMRLKVERRIKERYAYYLETERQALLNKHLLDYITPYLGQLDITEAQRAFVEESRNAVGRAAMRRRIYTAGVLLILILLALATWQWNKEIEKGKEAVKNERIKQARVTKLLKDAEVYGAALEFYYQRITLERVFTEDPDNEVAQQMLQDLNSRSEQIEQ